MKLLRLKVVVIGGGGMLGRARSHAALRALAVEGAMSGQALRITPPMRQAAGRAVQ
ncbi:hypothetical protein [Variovorax sp. 770b2]|uniref:hypothetical protein n=1 Tax=Variovorax sp. 770b2 TaxID=1566271 RepID=UPI0008EE22C7|nr:hypothetical protein [Variovorax sp. 770b2]SFP78777.1 hypothetical protein SAMN03159339_3901 [Variovorax sp. 770b2]